MPSMPAPSVHQLCQQRALQALLALTPTAREGCVHPFMLLHRRYATHWPSSPGTLHHHGGPQRSFCFILPGLLTNRPRQMSRRTPHWNMWNSSRDHCQGDFICHQTRYPGGCGVPTIMRGTDCWHRSCYTFCEERIPLRNHGGSTLSRCQQRLQLTQQGGCPSQRSIHLSIYIHRPRQHVQSTIQSVCRQCLPII